MITSLIALMAFYRFFAKEVVVACFVLANSIPLHVDNVCRIGYCLRLFTGACPKDAGDECKLIGQQERGIATLQEDKEEAAL